jgi:hypothetical protein
MLHTFDETQRCQLYHYKVVVIQLAALGFFKRVAAGSKPAYILQNTRSSFATVYLTIPALGNWVQSYVWTMRFTCMWGVPQAGGLCVVYKPYALTYWTMLHTFEETQRCQLYHHNVIVIQLAALGFFIWNKQHNSQLPLGRPTSVRAILSTKVTKLQDRPSLVDTSQRHNNCWELICSWGVGGCGKT